MGQTFALRQQKRLAHFAGQAQQQLINYVTNVLGEQQVKPQLTVAALPSGGKQHD